MIYLFLLVTGLVLGWIGKGLKLVISDYRLALKVNSIQFSMKEYDKMIDENKRIKDDLNTATQRIQILSASRQSNKGQGVIFNDDNPFGNRTSGLREND